MSELKKETASALAWSSIISICSQVITLGFSIILARLLKPDDYGMVGLLSIFVALANLFQEGGLIFALTNRKTVTTREYSTIFYFNLALSVFIYSILFFSAPLIANFYGKSELVPLSRYVFLGFLFSSCGIVQNAFFYKNMLVKKRGIINVSSAIFSSLIGVILAYNGFSYWGIATQGLLNVFLNVVLIWIVSPFRITLEFDWSFIKGIYMDGVRFMIPNVFSVVGGNFFSVILGRFYSVADVGYYSQASKWNEYAYMSVLNIVRNVSHPVLVRLSDDHDAQMLVFRKFVRLTAFIIIPLLSGISFVSNEFITVLLTDKWAFSANILRILCIGGIFSTITTIFTYLIMSRNKTSIYMRMGILGSLFQIIGVSLGALKGVLVLAVSYVVLQGLFFFLYYAIINKIAGYKLKLLYEDIAPIVFICLIVFSIVYVLTIGIDIPLTKLVMRVILSVAFYMAAVLLLRIDSAQEIISLIKNKI